MKQHNGSIVNIASSGKAIDCLKEKGCGGQRQAVQLPPPGRFPVLFSFLFPLPESGLYNGVAFA